MGCSVGANMSYASPSTRLRPLFFQGFCSFFCLGSCFVLGSAGGLLLLRSRAPESRSTPRGESAPAGRSCVLLFKFTTLDKYQLRVRLRPVLSLPAGPTPCVDGWVFSKKWQNLPQVKVALCFVLFQEYQLI